MRTFVETIAEEYGQRSEPPEIFCSLKAKPSMEELLRSSESTPPFCVTPREDERLFRTLSSGGRTPPIMGEGEGGKEGEDMVLSPVSDEANDEHETGLQKPRKKDRNARSRKQTKVATKFVWSGPARTSVELAGDFGNWLDRIPLEKKGEVFVTTLHLEPALYKFKYIVDGVWLYDGRRRTCTDEYGNVNNVISVGLKPVKFIWRQPAGEVSVTGSFCGWRHMISLPPYGEEKKVSVMIPPGDYEYKFVVDGVWQCDHSLPFRTDSNGNINNTLSV